MNVNMVSLFGDGPSLRPRWDRAKNELIMAAADNPDKLDFDLGLTFSIAIGDVEVFTGWSALYAIHTLAQEVQAVLMTLEAETRRLFPAAF